MGEDRDEEEEGVKEEETKEAQVQTEPKKRKAKAQPMAKTKENKIAKPSLATTTTPTNRASIRATTPKAKEQAKENTNAIEQKAQCIRNKEENTLHNQKLMTREQN